MVNVLDVAKRNKEDEFYTQISDIENELRHYKDQFKNKIIFCNCDDPYESNFFKYFAMNFNALKLKKLIANSYVPSPIAGKQLLLFDVDHIKKEKKITKENMKKFSYKIEITEVTDLNGDGAIDMFDVELLLKNDKNVLTLLEGNGDFRSDECINLMRESDIVVTNPPFSLFREFIDFLMKYEKKFLIIGGQNNVTYKETFQYIMNNKVWSGYYNGDMEFVVPDHYNPRKSRYREENGIKYRSFGNLGWYTNLDVSKRHEEIILYKKYKSDEYPKYDGYDIINVDKVADIPIDYVGIMGVPITFFYKYNPDQFEILGIANSARWIEYECYTLINNKKIYNRILIRNKHVGDKHED